MTDRNILYSIQLPKVLVQIDSDGIATVGAMTMQIRQLAKALHECQNGVIGSADDTTPNDSCLSDCKGQCGCEACHEAYADFLSME
jgi:hypothetical protein